MSIQHEYFVDEGIDAGKVMEAALRSAHDDNELVLVHYHSHATSIDCPNACVMVTPDGESLEVWEDA